MAINKAQVEKSYATNFLAAFKVLSIKVGEAYLAAFALDLILNAGNRPLLPIAIAQGFTHSHKPVVYIESCSFKDKRMRNRKLYFYPSRSSYTNPNK